MKKLLIANRGEIACRIMKTAKRLGWHTVAVYSTEDQRSLHVLEAHEAFHIGDSPPSSSYLRHDKILQVAIDAGVTAIHPGYGFLSENPEFSKNCAANNIVFVGPPSEAISIMGLKGMSRQKMEDAGIPVLPGINRITETTSIAEISAIGYPLLIKPEAGGGGKGMKIVYAEDEVTQALASAKREALSSFGNDSLMVEKFLVQPRHIEIQVFSDKHGNCVHLNERDCSLQRRHQKVVEESPAPHYPDKIRQAMGEAAVAAVKAIDYEGAGTIEFLLADDNQFYFMEMNTRLQVEHPVTEMVTGIDLVEWQLNIAMGEALPLTQNEIQSNGHAMEVRIYAEDPDNDFLPVSGKITALSLPASSPHIRIDSGIQAGDDIGVYYDPMLMKLISWGQDRDSAIHLLSNALSELHIAGFRTNRDFLYKLLHHPPFRQGALGTDYLDKHLHQIGVDSGGVDEHIALCAVTLFILESSRLSSAAYLTPLSFRLNAPHITTLLLKAGNESIEISVQTDSNEQQIINTPFGHSTSSLISSRSGHSAYCVRIDQVDYPINIYQCQNQISVFSAEKTWFYNLPSEDGQLVEDEGSVQAPMAGRIVSILVSKGDKVQKGTELAVLEAMKMEHSINAPADGLIVQINVAKNDLVDEGMALFDFEAEEN